MRTSPGPGSGSGTSVHSSTSGPPGSRATIAYTSMTVIRSRRVRGLGAILGHWSAEGLVQAGDRGQVGHEPEPAGAHLPRSVHKGLQGESGERAADADPSYADLTQLLQGDRRVRQTHH